jgi:hypothetical protein
MAKDTTAVEQGSAPAEDVTDLAPDAGAEPGGQDTAAEGKGTAEGQEAAPAAAPKDEGPKTMAEAIEQGLSKGKDNKKPAGEQAAGKPGEDGEPPAGDKKPEAKKPEPKKDAKPGDEDFEQPDGLSERSQGRFKRLVERAKSAEGRVEAFMSVMQDNGIQQEQFSVAVDYMGAINRGDYEAAKAILTKEMEALALATGQDFQPADPLAMHPDLKQAVDALEMPRERAIELARFRTVHGFQAQQAQEQRQQQEAQQHNAQQWDSAKNAAVGEIDAFIKEKSQTDLDYAVKGPILEANAVEWCKGLPPSEWPAQIKRMYDAIGKAARQSANAGNGARPLRGAGVGAGAKPAPRTMHEAMWGSPAA